jgi:hypothetical protein
MKNHARGHGICLSSGKYLTKGEYMRFPGILAGCMLAALATAPAHAVVISATNSSEVVVDGSSDTRTVAFGIADLAGGANSIVDVNITIDFMKCEEPLTTPLPSAAEGCINGGDAFAQEIIFRLTSPGGTEISLVEFDTYFPGGSGPTPGARIVVTFDDGAATMVGGTDFVGGTFAPIEPLTGLNGEGATGTWTLYIEDAVSLDPLGFASFTLDITLADPTAAPAPGTILLFGIGTAALLGRRRRSR